ERKRFIVLCFEEAAKLVSAPPLRVDQLLGTRPQPSGGEKKAQRQKHDDGQVVVWLLGWEKRRCCRSRHPLDVMVGSVDHEVLPPCVSNV
ncbi:MAG: hypothetical protein ACXV98_02360, partial [Ilumatobacteraceae bacterium]